MKGIQSFAFDKAVKLFDKNLLWYIKKLELPAAFQIPHHLVEMSNQANWSSDAIHLYCYCMDAQLLGCLHFLTYRVVVCDPFARWSSQIWIGHLVNKEKCRSLSCLPSGLLQTTNCLLHRKDLGTRQSRYYKMEAVKISVSPSPND